MAHFGAVGTAAHGVARVVGRRLRAGGRALAAGVAEAAARLAYRRRELVVVGLSAASVLGGLAVRSWHRRAPATLERLEAEPPRPTAPLRPTAARTTAPPRGRHAEARSDTERAPPLTAERPLDLNRASAADLARLPGIGARLAARIVARRDAIGGRFRSAEELASVPGFGARRAALVRPLVAVGVAEGEGAAETAPDPAESRELP